MRTLLIACLLSLPAAANAQSCPDRSQLTRALGDNLVDTRGAALTLSPRERHKMRWAPGHRKALPSSFWLTPERAVEAVVAVEAREPRIIPAPFRAQIAAAPRDAEVRLRVAACEIHSPQTRRRGAHDAAMALLLGAPADKAMPLLEAGADEAPDDHAFSSLSQPEIDVEDALTRAILRRTATGRGGVALSTRAADRWIVAMVHRCGRLLCRTSDDGRGTLVTWDIRDGGTDADAPATPAPKTASREACLMHTNRDDLYGCVRDCEHAFPSGSQELGNCEMRCEHYCRR